LVGTEGHHYHKEVIFPKLLPLLKATSKRSLKLVDLACGDGVLARQLPKNCEYLGIDASTTLINKAKSLDNQPKHKYLVADITKPLAKKIVEEDIGSFTHAAIILALQNLSDLSGLAKNMSMLLQVSGEIFIILNHPCFRIPRQSSWGVDQEKKLQFRRIDRYLSPMEIPIQTHPGQGERSSQTLSFHLPLTLLTQEFFKEGFAINLLEEWCSDKSSSGKNKKMEDRAREEFPLFLALRMVKL
jgi:ubiquinone/menaquinone biosynthesis C-methylase UbiE